MAILAGLGHQPRIDSLFDSDCGLAGIFLALVIREFLITRYFQDYPVSWSLTSLPVERYKASELIANP
jgi:hypothetical protein